MQCFVDGQFIRNCIVFEMVIIAKRYFGTPTRINGRNHRSLQLASCPKPGLQQFAAAPNRSNLCGQKDLGFWRANLSRGNIPLCSGEQPYSKLLDGRWAEIFGWLTSEIKTNTWTKRRSFFGENQTSCSGPKKKQSGRTFPRRRSGQRASSFLP